MMKNTILGVLLVAGIFGPPSFPEQAQEKYASEAYLESADLYLQALDEYPTQRPHLNFNIAQGFLRMDSTQRALNFMSQATSIGKRDKKLASLAWNNIGGIHAATQPEGQMGMPGQAGQPQAGQPDKDAPSPQEQALEDFKNALRNDPDNETARYNYELMKRKLQQQQQQQEQNEDEQEKKEDEQQEEEKKDQKDQQNKNDQNNDQKDQQQDQQENKENKGNNPKQGEGEAQKMSMEQAKMLLNAMNENEKKFLQQLQKSKAKRPNRERGPEW